MERSCSDLKRFAAIRFYLTNENKYHPGPYSIAVAALRFLYKVSLSKNWIFDDVIPGTEESPKGSPLYSARMKSCNSSALSAARSTVQF